jgi:hypothetical protein
VHAGRGCSARVERFVLDQGGFGAFVAGGEVQLIQGAVARHVDALGGRGEGEGVLGLTHVIGLDNANDGVIDDASLPEASALEAPTGVCLAETCPP